MSKLARCPALTVACRVLDGIAPCSYAAKWDNVGLLIDATRHALTSPYRVFFTNDLTPKVLDEAVKHAANLIVTYHPTPFSSMKVFKAENTAANVVLTCAANGIAVYSPHTALDAVSGGINDWLVDGISSLLLPDMPLDRLNRSPIKKSDDAVAAAAGVGDGRITTLMHEVTLADIVGAVKDHLKVEHVQVALPSSDFDVVSAGKAALADYAARKRCKSFAVCAGSGASVLAGCKADVYITGEMSHHEVLAANHAGVVVILTRHSKCERGYLRVLETKFKSAWREVMATSETPFELSTHISLVDEDPLVVF